MTVRQLNAIVLALVVVLWVVVHFVGRTTLTIMLGVMAVVFGSGVVCCALRHRQEEQVGHKS